MRCLIPLLAIFLMSPVLATTTTKGLYTLDQIEKKSTYTRLHFSSKTRPNFIFEPKQIHISLTPKRDYTITLQEERGVVVQMMVHPHGGSARRAPIWLLSRHQSKLSLKGVPYLEMHAPTNDYLVF